MKTNIILIAIICIGIAGCSASLSIEQSEKPEAHTDRFTMTNEMRRLSGQTGSIYVGVMKDANTGNEYLILQTYNGGVSVTELH